MENNTNMKIPKKYEPMISEISQDENGYCVRLNKGYKNSTFDAQELHLNTQKQVKEELKNIISCNCEESGETKQETKAVANQKRLESSPAASTCKSAVENGCGSNNFLKLHGLPIKRKLTKRKQRAL